MDHHYKAFISYSRTDRDTAKKLQRMLERYVIPAALRSVSAGVKRNKRPIAPCFRDEDELVPGSDLGKKIHEALAASEYMIVVCSKAAAKSEWVDKEIREFSTLGRSENILAVVIDGEPHATNSIQEALPPALKFDLSEDGKNTDKQAEPLWIDWREGAHNDRSSILRIVAALLSLASLDDLIRRDQKARQLKLWTGSAIALTVTAALGGFGILTLNTEINQVRQRALLAAEVAARANVNEDHHKAARIAVAGMQGFDHPIFGFDTAKLESELHDALASGITPLVLRGHAPNYLTTAVFSPDGSKALTASGNGDARIWDAITGQQLGEKMDMGSELGSARFSPDGSYVVTLNWDEARIWDAETGISKNIKIPMSDKMLSLDNVIFNPSGTQIIGLADSNYRSSNSIQKYDVATGKPIGASAPHPDVEFAMFSGNGQRILSVKPGIGDDGITELRVWNAETMEAVSEPIRLIGYLISIDFNYGGTHIITGYYGGNADFGQAVLWEVDASRQVVPALKFNSPVEHVAFDHQGQKFATGIRNSASVWRTKTGALVSSSKDIDGPVQSVRFSKNGRVLLTAYIHGARILESNTGQKRSAEMRHEHEVDKYYGVINASFNQDSTRVITAGADGTAKIWNIDTNTDPKSGLPLIDQVCQKLLHSDQCLKGGDCYSVLSDQDLIEMPMINASLDYTSHGNVCAPRSHWQRILRKALG